MGVHLPRSWRNAPPPEVVRYEHHHQAHGREEVCDAKRWFGAESCTGAGLSRAFSQTRPLSTGPPCHSDSSPLTEPGAPLLRSSGLAPRGRLARELLGPSRALFGPRLGPRPREARDIQSFSVFGNEEALAGARFSTGHRVLGELEFFALGIPSILTPLCCHRGVSRPQAQLGCLLWHH